LAVIGLAVGNLMLLREQRQTSENLRLAFRALDKFCAYIGETADDPDESEPKKEILDLMKGSLEIYERLTAQRPTDPATRWEAARAHHRVGEMRHKMGQADKAVEPFLHADALLTRLVADAPHNPEYRSEWIEVIGHLGHLDQAHRGRPAAATK